MSESTDRAQEDLLYLWRFWLNAFVYLLSRKSTGDLTPLMIKLFLSEV